MFRADIPIKFRVTPSAFQTLIDDLEETMKFSIEEEEKVPMEYVTNFDEVIKLEVSHCQNAAYNFSTV